MRNQLSERALNRAIEMEEVLVNANSKYVVFNGLRYRTEQLERLMYDTLNIAIKKEFC